MFKKFFDKITSSTLWINEQRIETEKIWPLISTPAFLQKALNYKNVKPLTDNTLAFKFDTQLEDYLTLLSLLAANKNVILTESLDSNDLKKKQTELVTFEIKSSTQFIGLSTTGSTGAPKTVLHDLDALINLNNKSLRGTRFLSCVPGHTIGGISSFLWSLFGNADFYAPADYSPNKIASLIEKESLNTLSCPPTFLRFFLYYLNAHPDLQLKSLTKILYGSEPMDQSSLLHLCRRLPHVEFQQKYASTEFGFSPFRSESRESIAFLKKSSKADIKIVDQKIRIKAPHSFITYLEPDIPSPIDESGYFITNDLIDESPENNSFTIMGRDSEWAIVAGKKIHLRSLEKYGLEHSFILDCYAQAKTHSLLGQIISMQVLIHPDFSKKNTASEIRDSIRTIFRNHPSFHIFVPQEIVLVTEVSEWKLIKKRPLISES